MVGTKQFQYNREKNYILPLSFQEIDDPPLPHKD